MIKVGMISLGCAKNLVDAEIMAGHLLKSGMTLTNEATEADVLIVNTCSFIDAAKEESIEAIFDANRTRGMHKRSERQKLIVAGCMAQRFSKELQKEMPEVDAFIGLDQVTSVAPLIEKLCSQGRDGEEPENHVSGKSVYIPDYDTPRFRLTPSHFAYVKIAEGCNHPCSFCVIPQMRGKHRSRTIHSVVSEVRQMVSEGVCEMNLISQDTTYFGMDRWDQKAGPKQKVDSSRGETISNLLKNLDAVEGDYWLRLLYTHPAHWSEELMDVIAGCRHVVPYVDMPLQHIAPGMLDRMRRETSKQHIVDLVRQLRIKIPGLVLRTTFIVGFPGETEEEFQELLDFMQEVKFERLGVFEYSQEEGSRAAKMESQIPAEIKKDRWRRAMKLQQKLSRDVASRFVGTEQRVLVESPGIARSMADAPDVDARVYVNPSLPVGAFADVKITAHLDYDLVAEGGVAKDKRKPLKPSQ